MISIIIPTYNSEATIRVCMDSLKEQTFQDFEVIIVDSASNDATRSIIEEYNTSLRRLSFQTEKDDGIYDAMNKGIERANGTWLYFMGSDDCFCNKNVLNQMAPFLNNGTDIVYGNSTLVPENIDEFGAWDMRRLLNMCINHQRIFYRAELFKKYGSYNINYPIASDYELNIRLFTNPNIIKKYIDCNIAWYYSGGFSANKIDERFWNDFRNVMLKKFEPYLPKREIYERLGFYCWYKMQKGDYVEAIKLFVDIGFHTRKRSFLKHSLSQLFRSLRN